MNYYGRISTANSLTHYGKKGMKWKKHKNLTVSTANGGDVVEVRDDYNGDATYYHRDDGSKTEFRNEKTYSKGQKKVTEYDMTTKDKNYRKYEVNKAIMTKSWDQIKNKNLTKDARINAGKKLIKNGLSAIKNRVTGSKRTKHVSMEY